MAEKKFAQLRQIFRWRSRNWPSAGGLGWCTIPVGLKFKTQAPLRRKSQYETFSRGFSRRRRCVSSWRVSLAWFGSRS